MIEIALILPTLILLTSLGVYKGLKRESEKFIEQLKEANDEISKIMKLIFLKKIIRFFSESKTSRDTDMLLEDARTFAQRIEDGATSVTNDAFYEIADLHDYLDRINNKQKNLASIDAMFSILVKIIVAFGVIVASVQYSIIIYLLNFSASHLMRQVNFILAGASLVMGSVIILVYLDIARRSSKIKNDEELDMDLAAENTGVNVSGIRTANR